jgi:hypothetical protein
MLDTTKLDRTIKAAKAIVAKLDHAENKAEQYRITLGQHLKTIKELSPDQETFLQIVQEQVGLGKSRTYELLQIADGTKTVEEVRKRSNKSSGKSHAKARGISRPLISGQTADAGSDYPADYQSPWEAHGQPAPDEGMPEGAPDLNPAIVGWDKATPAQRCECVMANLIEIQQMCVDALAAAEPTTPVVIEPKKRGRPAGAKNKPKPIAAEATEVVADAAVPPSIDGEIYLSPSEADYGAALNAERQRRWESAPALVDPYEIPPMLDRTQGVS